MKELTPKQQEGLRNFLTRLHEKKLRENLQARGIQPTKPKSPDFAEVHYILGTAYVRLGRNQEAVEAYKEAIRLKPDYADAHYNLGIFYLLLNDKGSALEEYKILKDLNQKLANELFNRIYK
jgi:tetratricopeptide (TPR) repeat protein